VSNRYKPIGNTKETLANRYEKIIAWLQRIRDLGCEFRKLLQQNPGLENELSSHPYARKSPINIRDA
jgi:hypothetical protein